MDILSFLLTARVALRTRSISLPRPKTSFSPFTAKKLPPRAAFARGRPQPPLLMQADPTENARRARQAELNNKAASRNALEAQYGQVWNTEELRHSRWEIIGFMAPFVVVRDKTTGQRGSLEFQHSPRLYFNYHAD
jgi:hypothetical protein